MSDDESPVPYDAGEASLLWIGGVKKVIGVCTSFEAADSHVVSQLKSYLTRERKDVAVHLMTEAMGIILKQNELIRSLKRSVEEQNEKTIELQEELLDLNSESENSMKSKISQAITESVSDTVNEIKSYSSAVSSNQAQASISQKSLQVAVKTVMEEEERVKNVIVFGLEETQVEALEEKVGAVFEELGEKLKHESSRIGLRKPGVSRPVKVKLRNGAAAQQILRKSSELKKSARFTRVFLCPDRSEEEREVQRKLVVELRKKIAEEPHKSHVIRDGTITSRIRTVGGSG